MIMSKIEPDLTSAIYPTLDEKYKGETPEQKAAREARYAKAMVEFKKQFDAYNANWESQMHATQAGLLTALEDGDHAGDAQALANLESSISAA